MRGRVLVLLFAAPCAHADGILDYIRNYDLNDYALGVSYSTIESPYAGDDSTGFAYPYLTSFRHSAFTDDWLILTGGDVGARWVNDAGWVLGAVTRIRTEGTEATLLDELADIDVRKWTVEAAPLVGWRGWPVHFELKWYNEIFSDYSGPTTEFTLSLPREHVWAVRSSLPPIPERPARRSSRPSPGKATSGCSGRPTRRWPSRWPVGSPWGADVPCAP